MKAITIAHCCIGPANLMHPQENTEQLRYEDSQENNRNKMGWVSRETSTTRSCILYESNVFTIINLQKFQCGGHGQSMYGIWISKSVFEG